MPGDGLEARRHLGLRIALEIVVELSGVTAPE